MKNNAFFIKVGIISCLLITSFVLLIMGHWVNIFSVMFPSTVLSGFIFWIVNKHLWKIKLLKSLFGNLPNLNGEWIASVQKAGDKELHEMKITIKQTWSSIRLEFVGDRVTSQSTMATLSNTGDHFQLQYMWCGFFKAEYKPRMTGKLEGAAILNFYSELDILQGIYWTFAQPKASSTGEMTFTRINGKNK